MAINVGDAVVKLGLDKTQFNQGMKDAATETEKGAKRMQDGMRKAAIAITAVGAAGLLLIKKARDMNAELGKVALTTGYTAHEMRGLALELSNVTFRLKSVINTLTLLARAGITDEEVLKDVANAFDTLGDAIGSSAEEVASNMIPAMKTFGLTGEEIAGKIDTLAFLALKTTMTLDDFNTMVGYTTPELVAMGLTVDDLAAALIYMERQGYAPGRVMTQEFMRATTLAAAEQIPLTEALGMTTEALQSIQLELENTTGMAQTYADVANEQYGIVDKLASKWEDLVLVMGTMLTPLEPIFALMTALGPLMLAMSMTSLPGLIANLKASATALIGWAVAAGKAVAAAVVLAGAKIWAWASAIPIAGIAIAIAGVAALAVSIGLIRKKAMAAAAGLAEGGIVTRPTRALIGEAGPEAVIPLSKAGLMGSRDVHVHIGNYMGDEISLRQLGRKLSQILQEDGRRNAFGQVQDGYYFGRSSP